MCDSQISVATQIFFGGLRQNWGGCSIAADHKVTSKSGNDFVTLSPS